MQMLSVVRAEFKTALHAHFRYQAFNFQMESKSCLYLERELSKGLILVVFSMLPLVQECFDIRKMALDALNSICPLLLKLSQVLDFCCQSSQDSGYTCCLSINMLLHITLNSQLLSDHRQSMTRFLQRVHTNIYRKFHLYSLAAILVSRNQIKSNHKEPNLNNIGFKALCILR